MDLEIKHVFYLYLAIEVLKFLAAKFISTNEHTLILKEISRYQLDSAIVLERILSGHDIKPKGKEEQQ